MNYLHLFSLPELSFEIDLIRLEEKYLALQKSLHVQGNIVSLISVSDINQGYEILKNDVKRSEYILVNCGVDILKYKIPQEFYEYIFEVIDDIADSDDLEKDQRIDTLKYELQSLWDEFMENVKLNAMNAITIISFLKFKYLSSTIDHVKHHNVV